MWHRNLVNILQDCLMGIRMRKLGDLGVRMLLDCPSRNGEELYSNKKQG